MEKKKTGAEKLISIIIINWNGEKFLPACFESVKAQDHEQIEIILVDNGSIDNSLNLIPPNVDLIKNELNKGFCGAANQGIKKSTGEFVILLNSDVYIDKSFVSSINDTFVDNETVGMVSGKILRPDGKTIDSTGQFMNYWAKPVERGYNKLDKGQYDKEADIFSVCGAAACYRRTMLEDVRMEGGEYFDEDYFAFNEDLDLGWRARLKSWNALYDPFAIAYHHRGGTNDKTGRFQISGRPKDIQARIVLNRHFTIIKNISMIHYLMYSPFFVVMTIIDILFVIIFITDFHVISYEMRLYKLAWKKRAVIQAGRTTPDKIIRKYII